MNITDSLKKTREEVDAEINRLLKVRDDLDKMIAGGGAAPIRTSGQAPKGALKEAILNVLKHAKDPLAPRHIRDKMLESGYRYSVNPSHISKYIAEMMNDDKTVKRSGIGRATKYALK
jgi:hypothetical protein